MAQEKSRFAELIKNPFAGIGIKPKKTSIPKLVIAINQVDNLATPEAPWNSNINLPSPELEEIIKNRVEDIIAKLSEGAHSASRDQIEYFSALRAYRLPMVINKIVHNSDVITTSFAPKDINDPECAPEMNDEMRKMIADKLEAQRKEHETAGMDAFIARLMETLSPEDAKKLKKGLSSKKETAIKVAVIGQSGVGKSSTVNNLFGAKQIVSRTGEGTTVDNYGGSKEYELPDGSKISVADLPGYGREARTDENYKKMYIDVLKDVDIILLVIQANDKAIVDDQEMVQCLYEWSKEGLI